MLYKMRIRGICVVEASSEQEAKSKAGEFSCEEWNWGDVEAEQIED